jgi:hypothetical protein
VTPFGAGAFFAQILRLSPSPSPALSIQGQAVNVDRDRLQAFLLFNVG